MYGNSANGTGEQLFLSSGGTISVGAARVGMASSNKLQVYVQQGGAFISAPQSEFACPLGSQFSDAFNGIYGANAQTTNDPTWSSNPQCSVLVSSLGFSCASCTAGTYGVGRSVSNGSVSTDVSSECIACPAGGWCRYGRAVSAAPGFWGAASTAGRLEFARCPAGYCCTGDDGTSYPCGAVNSCAADRGGPLCGACAEGYR